MEHSEADLAEYIDCVKDLLEHEAVQSMARFTQHHGTEVLEHSLYVSYLSFRVCKERGYDYRSAARGGLLHDFFLYQRYVNQPYKGWHLTQHPRVALKNADELFALNPVERDIIARHMWPITVLPPRHRESYIVCMVDKFCCVMESFKLIKNNKARRIKRMLAGRSVA